MSVLVRHDIVLVRRDIDPVPAARLDDIAWLERAAEGLQASLDWGGRLPVAERDAPALRRAALARLGELGSDESLRAIARIERRRSPATAAELQADPLRVALFAQFTLADRRDTLLIEPGRSDVSIDGYQGVISYAADRETAPEARRAGGSCVSWDTTDADSRSALVTIREWRVHAAVARGAARCAASARAHASGTIDLAFLQRTAERWVLVGHRRTWVN